MIFRKLLAFVFLGFVLAFASVLAMGWTNWWLRPVHWLGHHQSFHIVAHFSIFAGVVFLYYPQQRGTIWLWALVVGGSVLLELVQILSARAPLTKPLLLDSIFDIAVDLAGAAACWSVLALNHHRKAWLAPASEGANPLHDGCSNS